MSIWGGLSSPYSTVLPARAYEVQPTSPPSDETLPDKPSLPARKSTGSLRRLVSFAGFLAVVLGAVVLALDRAVRFVAGRDAVAV